MVLGNVNHYPPKEAAGPYIQHTFKILLCCHKLQLSHIYFEMLLVITYKALAFAVSPVIRVESLINLI